MKPSSLPLHSAFLIALCAASACTIDPKRPSTVDSDPNVAGASSSSGGAGTSGSSNGDAGAGEAGDGSVAGGGGAAGEIGDNGVAGAPVQPGPSVCRPEAMWASPTKLSELSTAGAQSLLSLTADELDVLILRGAALFVAHRSKATEAFGTLRSIAVPNGWSATNGAALSPDGKRLLLISAPDQKQIGQLTRSSRDAAFAGEVDTAPFSKVNTAAVYSGQIYASPAVSPGDGQLFLSSSFPKGASYVVVSLRGTDAQWAAPVTIGAQLLDGTNSTRRLPTGVSADERTLFYFNEESGAEEARFRDSALPTSPLYDMRMLGARRGATPNAACDQLYSSTNSDVVVEAD